MVWMVERNIGQRTRRWFSNFLQLINLSVSVDTSLLWVCFLIRKKGVLLYQTFLKFKLFNYFVSDSPEIVPKYTDSQTGSYNVLIEPIEPHN